MEHQNACYPLVRRHPKAPLTNVSLSVTSLIKVTSAAWSPRVLGTDRMPRIVTSTGCREGRAEPQRDRGNRLVQAEKAVPIVQFALQHPAHSRDHLPCRRTHDFVVGESVENSCVACVLWVSDGSDGNRSTSLTQKGS